MVMPTQGSWTLENRWSRIKAEVSRTKDFCNKALPAAILYRHEVAEFANVLTNRLTVLDQYTANATVNGLVSYAQTQEADPTLDLVADYTSMRAAMITVRDWIVANAITAGDGTLAIYTGYDSVTKLYGPIELTAGQLSAFKIQLATLDATIA